MFLLDIAPKVKSKGLYPIGYDWKRLCQPFAKESTNKGMLLSFFKG